MDVIKKVKNTFFISAQLLTNTLKTDVALLAPEGQILIDAWNRLWIFIIKKSSGSFSHLIYIFSGVCYSNWVQTENESTDLTLSSNLTLSGFKESTQKVLLNNTFHNWIGSWWESPQRLHLSMLDTHFLMLPGLVSCNIIVLCHILNHLYSLGRCDEMIKSGKRKQYDKFTCHFLQKAAWRSLFTNFCCKCCCLYKAKRLLSYFFS